MDDDDGRRRPDSQVVSMDWEGASPECACYLHASSSYDQSLEEVQFQKSACHFAQIGNVGKLKQLLEKDFEMDQLSRYRTERVDAFTLRFEKWKNRVREDAVGEEVQMRRERENKIWERDSVDASECSWGRGNSRHVVESWSRCEFERRRWGDGIA